MKVSISNKIFFLLNLCQVSKKHHCPLHIKKPELFDMAYPLSQWWPPTFTAVLSFLGGTCLACNPQLNACHEAADGWRHDVLTAVITLWIVTADQGHYKTIVAAILEKVLNRGDMLSEGYTSLLNLIINSKGTCRPASQWQIQTQREEPIHQEDFPPL